MPLFKGTGTPPGGTFQDRIRKAREHEPPPKAEPLPEPKRLKEQRLPREPVFVNATLIHGTGKLSCVVTNWNTLGARIEFVSNFTLQGNQLSLVAPNLGLSTPVRVAWQKAGSAGLIFVKQAPAAG